MRLITANIRSGAILESVGLSYGLIVCHSDWDPLANAVDFRMDVQYMTAIITQTVLVYVCRETFYRVTANEEVKFSRSLHVPVFDHRCLKNCFIVN